MEASKMIMQHKIKFGNKQMQITDPVY